MDLYEEAEYHSRRTNAAKAQRGGKVRDGHRKDAGFDDLQTNHPPKDGMTREEFREWKMEQVNLQQERVKTIMTRMARTANLEAKMETLKAAMGEEYETALDDDQDDIDTVLQVPHTGTAELITPQMIQQYEQQVTKLTWVKQKIQALQDKASGRQRRQAERQAELESSSSDDGDEQHDDGQKPSALLDMTAALANRKKRDEDKAEEDRLAGMTRIEKMIASLNARFGKKKDAAGVSAERTGSGAL